MNSKTILEKKIMVKPPYDTLYDLTKQADGSITAKTKNEFILPDELGPVSASEAGRHLAILGSIALSETSDKNKYYLAIQANILRKAESSEFSKELTLKTRIIAQSRKQNQTFGEIYNDKNELVFSIVVDYQILNTAVFEKIFKHGRNTTPTDHYPSPYQYRRCLTDIVIDDTQATACYGVVAPQDCKGHFNNYPALPVAIICHLFCEIAFQLLLNTVNSRYSKVKVNHALIRAHRLIFSGEHLTFRAKILKHLGQGAITVLCEAIVDGKVVADSESEIQGVSTH